MKIFIRTDGSTALGLGHIARCLSLAGELRKIGFEITFISKIDERGLKLIENDGYDCRQLPGNSDDREELRRIEQIMGKEPFPVIITDLYFRNAEYFDALRSISRQLIMVHDHDQFPLPAHMAVNGNLFLKDDALRSRYGDTRFLAGPEYFILHPLYAGYHRRPAKTGGRIEKITVNFGGSDMAGLTTSVLDLIKDMDAEISVVLGGLAESLGPVQRKASGNPRIHVLHNISQEEMAEVLYESDLLVTAGGITSFQSACVGTPMIIVCQTDTQLKNAVEMQKAGAAFTIGTGRDMKYEMFFKAVLRMKHSGIRRRMSQACKTVCDGSGAARVAREINEMVKSSCNAVAEVT